MTDKQVKGNVKKFPKPKRLLKDMNPHLATGKLEDQLVRNVSTSTSITSGKPFWYYMNMARLNEDSE